MSSMMEIRNRTDRARILVRLAAFEYRRGHAISAVIFEIAAIEEYCDISKAVTTLTEAEADLIEPCFTDLEKAMQALPRFAFANNTNGFVLLCERN